MIVVYTILIGASRVGAIWARRFIYRQVFKTATVVFVTFLYIDVQQIKQKKREKFNKKKRVRIEPRSKGFFSRVYYEQNRNDEKPEKGLCWSERIH